MAIIKEYPKIIVVTGAESTGKSILIKQLAKHYNAPYYPEYAREYISQLDRKYTFRDIEIIAEKQAGQYEQALHASSEFVFFDTWLIITKVWFEVVFNECPRWVIGELQSAKIRGFLLNDIDIPWEPDPLRENGGEKRRLLHRTYIQNLKDFGFQYCLNSGANEIRKQNAIKSIEEKFR